MKHLLLISLLTICLLRAEPAVDPASGLRVGDAESEIEKVLGAPDGFLRVNGRAVYIFERGLVQAENGVITKVDLLDPAETAARRERRQEEEAARRQEGEAKRDLMLAHPDYARLTGEARLRYWLEFQQNFPGVDVVIPLELARAEAETEAARQREVDRLASLERRVTEAERSARQAWEQAETARIFAQSQSRHRDTVVVWPSTFGYIVRPGESDSGWMGNRQSWGIPSVSSRGGSGWGFVTHGERPVDFSRGRDGLRGGISLRFSD